VSRPAGSERAEERAGAEGSGAELHERCEIVEVGPRDGLQNESLVLDVDTRVELVVRALDAGLRRVEAASFVRADRVPQMAGAEELMSALPRRPGVRYAGLVLNLRGLERALSAGVDEVNAVVAVTDAFSGANQGVPTEQAVAAWRGIAEEAHAAGVAASVTISVAFGCPFEGEVAPSRVEEVVASVAAAHPAEVVLADTIGAAAPGQVRELVERTRVVLGREAPGASLRCHFHNTRNTGYANALAAFERGVRVLDASLGGAGGCPFAPAATGNIATEDLVFMLDRMGVETGVDLAAAIAAGRWLGAQLGTTLPSMLDRAGPFPATTAARTR
jgi:hydroxymethylglutaryl-CoA lyase